MTIYNLDMRGQAMFLPGTRKESNPFVAQRTREGVAADFKRDVMAKWEIYKRDFGYKDTFDSAKAASLKISAELAKKWKPFDTQGNRQNDPETVYAMIKPFGVPLPWWANWKLLAGGAVAILILPGMLGRYLRARR